MSGYQGWKNYPTWCVKLWIDNDEGLYNDWRDRVQEEVDTAGSKAEFTPHVIADALKDQFEEMAPTLDGMWSDLFTYALGEVDWFEIAESMIEDADEPETEE